MQEGQAVDEDRAGAIGVESDAVADEARPCAAGDGQSRVQEADALYLYCVVPGTEPCEWPGQGIDGSTVFSVPSGGLAALAHACKPEPYSGPDEMVRSWITAHARVVEKARELWGTVVPMGFDVIVRATDEHTAWENVALWLQRNRDHLHSKLEEFRGHSEYGVQVFVDRSKILDVIRSNSKRVNDLVAEMSEKPDGIQYFYRQRVEKILKEEMEAFVSAAYRDYFRRISELVHAVVVNKLKGDASEKCMILNLSVLVPDSDEERLGHELEKIAADYGIDVRFTGPWPPYSFVGMSMGNGVS